MDIQADGAIGCGDEGASWSAPQVSAVWNDGPGDICGGLREALKLDWQGESRDLFLLADAPCHGSKYHGYSDNYLDGDPTTLVPGVQFEGLLGSRQVK